MSSTSGRLLANRCCVSMLLLAVASIITAKPTTAQDHTHNASRHLSLNQGGGPTFWLYSCPISAMEPSKGNQIMCGPLSCELLENKCQYNLLDSSISLEAESSTYQNSGFSQCQYIIWSPSSRFILLNFTDIRSQSDMPVDIGLQGQNLQQAANKTPSAVNPALTAPVRPPLLKKHSGSSEEKSKTNATHPSNELVPSAVSNGATFSLTPSENSSASQKVSVDSSSSGRSGEAEKTLTEERIRDTVTRKGSEPSNNSDSQTLQGGWDRDDFQLSTSSGHIESQDPDSESSGHQRSDRGCVLKLIIEEVNRVSGSSPQVICWQTSSQRNRVPLVYRYRVPIKITYQWDTFSHSGFSLDFSFLRPEAEVDCSFQCQSHQLCLPLSQLCDGYKDCPDLSDEFPSACSLARQQEKDEESHVMIVVIAVVCTVLVLVISGLLMISRIRRHAARQGRDSLLQPPHSQSTEVYRSTSGSMQDNGQYEALLHERHHPDSQRQIAAPTVLVANTHSLEHHQLLHQPQQQVALHHHHNPLGDQPPFGHDHQISPTSFNTSVDKLGDYDGSRLSKSMHIKQPRKHHHHSNHQQQQLHLLHHKPAHQQLSPHQLYPPSIPLSGDGEEGYANAQKALCSKQQMERNWVESDMFRPPPNKSVMDRDSPPPPYSLNPPGAQSLDSLVHHGGVLSVLRQAGSRGSVTPQGSPTGVSQSLPCHH